MKIQKFVKLVGNIEPYFDLSYSEVGQFMMNDTSYVIISDMKTVVVTTQKQFDEYLFEQRKERSKRKFIQDIFPELTGMERQFIQSGYFFGKFDGQSFNNAYKIIKNDSKRDKTRLRA